MVPKCTAFDTQKWLSTIDPDDFWSAFEELSDVQVFIKDRSGRLLKANRGVLDRLGLRDDSSLIETTDSERYAKPLADVLQQVDSEVMETGIPIRNKVEILHDHSGALCWGRTSKFPLRNKTGDVVGLIGITMTHQSESGLAFGNHALDRAIEFIRRSPPGALRVECLAKAIGISVRTINRAFRQVIGMTTQAFILRNRLHAAARAILNTPAPLADIAANYGFFDQSAFTRQFRREFHVTPRSYRLRGGKHVKERPELV